MSHRAGDGAGARVRAPRVTPPEPPSTRIGNVVRLVRAADPAIDPAVAQMVAAHCLTMLDERPSVDADGLVPELLSIPELVGADVAWVVLVARAAVQVSTCLTSRGYVGATRGVELRP